MAVGDGVSAIASLAMTFGGFSPTAMDGVEATKEQIERVEAAQAKKREADERRREIERARSSAPKRFTDSAGATWVYVVLDGSFLRVDSCMREQARIVIPAEIEGLPVRAIGSDVFHESDIVEEIICPDSVEAIGACAFRSLPSLRRIVFPENVATFSSSWVQHCALLEEMVLPGLLDEIKAAVFDNLGLKRVTIGKNVSRIEPGAFRKAALDEIGVDAENPFIMTDGAAVYSKDGEVLIAFARPVDAYAIASGCRKIARKAFDGKAELKRVEAPEGLEVVGKFAFTHAGLVHFTAPSTLHTIGEKGFYYCRELASVELNEGLESIGDSAFEESGLVSLHIPASIKDIGTSITRGTPIRYCGSERTIAIDAASPVLFIDDNGGLYRREDDGIHCIQLMDAEATSYVVFDGCAFIDERAFAFHENIESATLPEGVREVRASAFRVCRNLRRVSFPSTLKLIGKEAFIDTNLEAVWLPAGFEELSEDAFVTAGAHHLGDPPSLRSIEVEKGNPRFYVESGLLCRRGEDGDRGIVFNDSVADVVIPDAVTSIAPFAFCNARNIETISIGPNLQTIGSGGLSTWSYITDIHIEVAEPVEGRSVFDVRFPDTPRTTHEIAISLGGSAWVNVPDIMRHYDNCIAHAHDYHVDDNGTSAYEQVKLMLARLKDPIMLVPVNHSLFERIIREHLVDICVDVARHDDRGVVDDLCDFGFLNSDNLEEVIVAVGRLQDAAMSGYLLELKRRRFGRAAFDFDL